MIARKAGVSVDYNGINLKEVISNELVNTVTYNDNATDTIDDISIELKNTSKKWLSEWAPLKGDEIKLGIFTENWSCENDNHKLNCGIFIVDEIDYSGRPLIIAIKGLAIPKDIEFTETLRNRKWQNVSIKRLASDLVSKYNFDLVWDTNKNIIIESIEQSNVTDSSFLKDTCKKYGFSVKTYSNKIVIYHEGEYEKKTSVLKVKESDVESWTLKNTINDTGYTEVVLKYSSDNYSETKREFIYRLPGKKYSKGLKINETVNNYAEAEFIAKAKLREKNKQEYTMNLQLKGNTKIVACNCIDLEGFGIFDGKYFIDKISHSVGGGYKVSMDIHKVLEGDY